MYVLAAQRSGDITANKYVKAGDEKEGEELFRKVRGSRGESVMQLNVRKDFLIEGLLGHRMEANSVVHLILEPWRIFCRTVPPAHRRGTT